ncbi:hypothetical protein BU26DRAFT_557628 [Trematosphaeria pertusa]|uniref:Uncharacterized protein n=1 Tax=Trematosphaeria pertusa TaxID=390896 RepID=A0A6A6J3U9_9PLEO|nr:uncharacterized protein BU26DRAFT_557628 [Trematosphaeria pertusa]KAF2256153.1 hypothetical protein BU26DRAFT_557628 [Trematosphaeria pertusa]
MHQHEQDLCDYGDDTLVGKMVDEAELESVNECLKGMEDCPGEQRFEPDFVMGSDSNVEDSGCDSEDEEVMDVSPTQASTTELDVTGTPLECLMCTALNAELECFRALDLNSGDTYFDFRQRYEKHLLKHGLPVAWLEELACYETAVRKEEDAAVAEDLPSSAYSDEELGLFDLFIGEVEFEMPDAT